MAGNGHGNGDHKRRLFLLIPIAMAVCGVWVLLGIRAAVVGDDVQAFLIATGPMTGLCGYLFGLGFVRKNEK